MTTSFVPFVDGSVPKAADFNQLAQSAFNNAGATAADRIQTGQDRTATGGDRTQTGLDRAAVSDDKAAVEIIAAAFGDVATAVGQAQAGAGTASTQAGIATASATASAISAQIALVAGHGYASTAAALADAALVVGASFAAPLGDGSFQAYIKTSISVATAIGSPFITTASRFDPSFAKWLKMGKNHFNSATATPDFYVSSTGDLIANATYAYSDYIPVLASTAYARLGNYQLAFYNAEKAYLSGLASGVTFTTPAGAAFVRISVLKTALSTEQLELGAVSTTYEAFAYVNDPAATVPVKNVPSTGTVGTPQLADAAVTTRKSDFMVPGKNLFDKAALTAGYYVNYLTGALAASGSYSASEYIPAVAGQTYTRNFSHQLAFYDASFVFLSGVNAASPSAAVATTFSAPALTAYLRMGVGTAYIDTTQLELGSSATAYEAYIRRIASANLKVLAENLGVAAVTPVATSFMSKGKNLFDKAAVTAGYFVNSATGALAANASYSASAAMPVVAGQTYTRSFSHQMAWYTAAGVYISGVAAASPSAAVATQVVAPAGAELMRMGLLNTVLDDMQVELGSVATPYESFGYRVQSGYLPATSGDANFYTGAYLMRKTRMKLARLRGGAVAEQLVIACGPGDSYTHARVRWSGKLARDLKARYGDAGPGWCGFGYPAGSLVSINGNVTINDEVAESSFLTPTLTGSWTPAYATSVSPDLCHISSATAGDKVSAAWTGSGDISSVKLFYIGAASSAARYRWNGGAWTALDLAAVTGIGTIALASVPTGAWTLEIEVVGGTVALCGIDARKAGSGVVVHKLAATGSQLAQWVAVDAAQWEIGIAALGLDAMIIMHGANDQAAASPAATFAANMGLLIDRARVAIPALDVCVFMPPENNMGLPALMANYAAAVKPVAAAKQAGFLNAQYLFGESVAEYASTGFRPLLSPDNLHPLPATGGYVLTEGVWRFLNDV